MSTQVVMPQMGESIAEGTITKWHKKPGDRVERDEPLFEITTDKVDTEVPSPAAGVLEQILVQEGETVAVGTIVGMVGDGEAVATSTAATTQETAPKAEQTTEGGGHFRSSHKPQTFQRRRKQETPPLRRPQNLRKRLQHPAGRGTDSSHLSWPRLRPRTTSPWKSSFRSRARGAVDASPRKMFSAI